jgi:hypothetical protein
VQSPQAGKTKLGDPAYAVSSGFVALPILIYTVRGIRYVTFGRCAALQVVAFFAMLLPGFLAVIQTWMVHTGQAVPEAAD